ALVLTHSRCLISGLIQPAANVLQGARHAVVRTLYSRAHRIGLGGASCLLRGPCQGFSLDLFLAVIVAVLTCPALELLVLPEQELERLAHDVGNVRVDEFCVPVQVAPDLFLQAHLKGCTFWLLRRCFQECQVFPLLSLFAMHYRAHCKLLAAIPARGQNTALRGSGRAGAPPPKLVRVKTKKNEANPPITMFFPPSSWRQMSSATAWLCLGICFHRF